jgi:predicted transport protein
VIRSKLILALVFLPTLLGARMEGEQPAAEPALSEAADRSIDMAALEAQYPGQHGVYLDSSLAVVNLAKAVSGAGYFWSMEFRVAEKLAVFVPEDDGLSTIDIQVDRGRELQEAHFSVLTPDGRFLTYGLGDLVRSENGDGSCEYKFALPQVGKGSVVTRTYLISEPDCLKYPPMHYSIPMQFTLPCRKVTFSYACPANWKVAVKRGLDGAPLPMDIRKDPQTGASIMTFTRKDVPAATSEAFSPFYRELATYVSLDLTKIFMTCNGYRPLSYVAPDDWSGLADQFKFYTLNKDAVFSSRVQDQAKALAEGCTSDRDRMAKIIGWIQDTVRVADYRQNIADGLQGADYAVILEHKEGNPDQITGLAMRMLQAVGIDAKYLLMHSATDGSFDQAFVSYDQLGVPALFARVENKTYVLFPYRHRMPIDHVPEEYLGQKAMAIDRKGHFELMDIPLGNQADNACEEFFSITFQTDGKVLVEDERTLSGSFAFKARQNLADLEPKAQELALKAMLPFPQGQVTLKKHELTDLYAIRQPLKIKLTYEIDNLVARTPEEAVFSAGQLFAPPIEAQAKQSAETRQNPIRIYFDERTIRTITFKYPDTWRPETPLKDFKVETRFGSLQGSYRHSEGVLTTSQELTLRKAAAAKEGYPDLQALIGSKTPGTLSALVFKVDPETPVHP